MGKSDGELWRQIHTVSVSTNCGAQSVHRNEPRGAGTWPQPAGWRACTARVVARTPSCRARTRGFVPSGQTLELTPEPVHKCRNVRHIHHTVWSQAGRTYLGPGLCGACTVVGGRFEGIRMGHCIKSGGHAKWVMQQSISGVRRESAQRLLGVPPCTANTTGVRRVVGGRDNRYTTHGSGLQPNGRGTECCAA